MINFTVFGLVSAIAFCGTLVTLFMGRTVPISLKHLTEWIKVSPIRAMVIVPLVGFLVAYAGTKPPIPPPSSGDDPDPEEPVIASVGDYVKYDLEADLGIEIGPCDKKEKVSVKGLPAGLKLVATKQKDKKKVVTNVVYTIEGVATAVRDYLQQPAYAVVTSGGKTTWQPIPLSTVAQEVIELEPLALGESVTTNACEWLPGVTNGWSISGLPTGLKCTTKAVYSGSGKKKTLKYSAYTIYGKTSKPGLFTITAKKKVSSYYETLKYRVTVEPKAVDEMVFPSLTNRMSVVAVAETWNLTNDVGKMSSVSDLPTGLKFDSKKQTIKGTPSKAGTFVTTFKKTVGRKTKSAQILWMVEPNPIQPEVDFNVSGGVILNRNAGSSYMTSSVAVMTFNVTPGATVTVSGLPKGLSLKKISDGVWAIAGTPTAMGTSYVTVTAKLNGNTVAQSVAVKVSAHPLAGNYSGEVWMADDSYGGTVKLTVGSTGKVSLSLVENGVKTSASLKSVTAVEEDPMVPQEGKWTCTFSLKANKKGKTELLPKRTLTIALKRKAGEWELPYCDTESYKTANGDDFADPKLHRELSKAEIAVRVETGRVPSLPSVETVAILAGEKGSSADNVATGEVVVVSATYKSSAATYTVTGRLPDGKTFSASRPVIWWRNAADDSHGSLKLNTISASNSSGKQYLLGVYLPYGATSPEAKLEECWYEQCWGDMQTWIVRDHYGVFGGDWAALPATVSDALGEIPAEGLPFDILWRAAELPGEPTPENLRFAMTQKKVKKVLKDFASVSADGGETWVTSKDPISWSAGRASFNVVLDDFTLTFDLAFDKDGKLMGWAKKSHTEKDKKGKKTTIVDAVGAATVEMDVMP